MNQGTVTGGVVRGAVSAYTADRRRKVVFTIVITDSTRAKHPWNCEAEGDDFTLDHIEAEAQPGRGVKIDYELGSRPYLDPKSKIHKGEVRFLRVLKAEFAAPRGQEHAAAISKEDSA